MRAKLCRFLILAWFVGFAAVPPAAEPDPSLLASQWKPLFNGKDLSGWDTWLGPRGDGNHDPTVDKETPIGLNTDPLGVFTIVTKDGAPAIRVSGQVWGAIILLALLNNAGREDHVRHEALPFVICFGQEHLARSAENTAWVLPIQQQRASGICADASVFLAPAVAVVNFQPAF